MAGGMWIDSRTGCRSAGLAEQKEKGKDREDQAGWSRGCQILPPVAVGVTVEGRRAAGTVDLAPEGGES